MRRTLSSILIMLSLLLSSCSSDSGSGSPSSSGADLDQQVQGVVWRVDRRDRSGWTHFHIALENDRHRVYQGEVIDCDCGELPLVKVGDTVSITWRGDEDDPSIDHIEILSGESEDNN